MNKREANKFLAVILTTVAAMPGGAPEGVMYAALMNKLALHEFEALLDIAASVGLVMRAQHVVTITPRGREMAEKIEALAKEASASS